METDFDRNTRIHAGFYEIELNRRDRGDSTHLRGAVICATIR
jgi:hypothetical protein